MSFDSYLQFTKTNAAIEQVADEILEQKKAKVVLDRKRQHGREAINGIKKNGKDGEKMWLCLGDMFIKVPNGVATATIQKDIVTINAEIDSIDKSLKENNLKLSQLEGRSAEMAKAFSELKSITKEDAKMFNTN